MGLEMTGLLPKSVKINNNQIIYLIYPFPLELVSTLIFEFKLTQILTAESVPSIWEIRP